MFLLRLPLLLGRARHGAYRTLNGQSLATEEASQSARTIRWEDGFGDGSSSSAPSEMEIGSLREGTDHEWEAQASGSDIDELEQLLILRSIARVTPAHRRLGVGQ